MDMNKKSITKWFSLFILMLMTGVGSLSAQTLSIDDFEMKAGETGKVTINLVQGDIPVLAFQADVVMPEGLTVEGRPKAVSETLVEDMTPTVTYSNGRIVVYNSEALTFKDDASAVVTLTLKAAPDFEGGEIALSNIVVSGEGNIKIQPDDVFAWVTSDYVAPITTDPTLQVEDFFISAGSTQQVAINLVQGYVPVLAFQADVVLPEGLTVVGRPRAVSETLVEDMTPTVTYSNGRIVVYNSDALTFKDDASAVVMLTVQAASNFEGGEIALANIIVSGEGNVKIQPDDVFAQVSSDYEAPGIPYLSISDFEINAGQTKEINIEFVPGSISVLGFQANVNLPYGIEVVGVRAVEETLEEDVTPTVSYSNGRILVYNTENLVFKPENKAVVTLTFRAYSYFSGGDLSLTNIVLSGANNERITPNDVYAWVNTNNAQRERDNLAIVTNNALAVKNDAISSNTYYAEQYIKVDFENALSTAQELLGQEEMYDEYVYSDAANTLTWSLENMQASMKSYAVLKRYVDEVIPACIALAETCGLTDVASEYNNYLGFWAEVLNNGSWSSDDINAQTADIHRFLMDNFSPEMIPAGTDLTCLLINPSFDNGTNGWNLDVSGSGNYGTVCVDDGVDYGNMESWRNTFNFSQNLYNMPAGKYEITIQGFARNENDQENPNSEIDTYLYAGNSAVRFFNILDESQRRPVAENEPLWSGVNPDRIYWVDGEECYAPHGMASAKAYFNTINPLTEEPYYTNHLTVELLEDGELALGVYSDYNEWILFDNIHIRYLGPTENQENYSRALESVKDGGMYHVFTDIDNTRYYLNSEGYVVKDPAEAACFVFGWDLGCSFTNPVLTNGSTGELEQIGYINKTSDNRDTWERQVLFQNVDGMFAIRATNARSANWGADTYWDIVDYEGRIAAGYSLDKSYIWQIAFDEAVGANISINDDHYLSGDNFMDYQPNITLLPTNCGIDWTGMPAVLGALTIEYADNPLNIGKLTMNYNIAQGNYRRYNGYEYPAQSNTLKALGEASAEEIDIRMNLTDGAWNFISLPFDVRVSDITCDDSDVDWVIRRYDGATRAAGQMSDTWVNVGVSEILEAGKGYILHCNNQPDWLYRSCVFHFPACDKKELVFTTEDITLSLDKFDSEFSQNRNWNLIGNPYAAYIEIGSISFDAPITVWNGFDSYSAYSPWDDNYFLSPGEAFFVQCPDEADGITFFANARMSLYDMAYNKGYWAKRRIRSAQDGRMVYNIVLSDGELSDRTRVVINETASMEYEMNRDASKFFAMDASVPQIYSLEGGVQYAINERPFENGIVQLAAHFGKDGTYTLRLANNTENSVVLKDEMTGTVVDLTKVEEFSFTAKAGTTINRFYLIMNQNVTSIESLESEALTGKRVYSLDGRLLPSKPTKAGFYLIQQNGEFRKVYVK